MKIFHCNALMQITPRFYFKSAAATASIVIMLFKLQDEEKMACCFIEPLIDSYSSDWWQIDIWLVRHPINVQKEKEMFPQASHPKQKKKLCKVTGRTACIQPAGVLNLH